MGLLPIGNPSAYPAKRNYSVSVVIPTWNEERNMPIVMRSLPSYVSEIIIVDKYSKDRTVEIAKKIGGRKVRVLYDSVGKGRALRMGMLAARGDIIVTMDADCSHSSNEIGMLVEGIKAGFDICMGSRFIQGGGTADMPWYRVLGNKAFIIMVDVLWGMNYSDLCYGYRSFRKSAVKRLGLRTDGFGIETEISIKAAKRKMRILEVPSFEKKRLHGKGKLRTFSDGFRILVTILREVGN
jgi:glycosyltransferase involved in cell wall biosynthesis